MKEARGDIFYVDCDAVCITTNGFVKGNGAAVMGRGCAKQLAQMFTNIPFILGDAIKKNGNVTQVILGGRPAVVSFPVKPVSIICTTGDEFVSHMRFVPGEIIPGFACKASIDLICDSAMRLVELTDLQQWKSVALPQPGCGFGELSWGDVKPYLAKILDDRFTCYTF